MEVIHIYNRATLVHLTHDQSHIVYLLFQKCYMYLLLRIILPSYLLSKKNVTLSQLGFQLKGTLASARLSICKQLYKKVHGSAPVHGRLRCDRWVGGAIV